MSTFEKKRALKIAIVGSGYMAEEYAKILNQIPTFKISGIFSRNLGKSRDLASKYRIDFTARSIQELFDLTEADAVLICVSEESTLDVCLEAMRFSWVLLVEKPAGLDVRESEQLLLAKTELNRHVFVALNRRFYSSTKAALQALEGQNNLRIVSIEDQQDIIGAKKLKFHPKTIKNWMFANSIHLVDYISVFCRGSAKIIDKRVHIEGHRIHLICNFDFSSGDFATYTAVWNMPGAWRVNIKSAATEVELKPLEQIFLRTFPNRELSELAKSQLDVDFKPGLASILNSLNTFCVTGTSDLPTLEESHQTMQLIKEIYDGVNVVSS